MLLLVGAALAFRLPQLELRVVHGDEANQAAKAGMLFDEGVYRYDPHEHHGPTLYYATLPFLWLSGAANYCETQAATYRLVPLVFGVALILLLLPMRGALGPWAVLWAGLFVALSHAMVFYSRYYVQEMLFVFFAFMTQFSTLQGYPVSLFLEVDPLVGIATALTTHSVYRGLVWGLALVIPTLLLGRVFCGWFCPFGTVQHCIGWFTSIRNTRRRLVSNSYR